MKVQTLAEMTNARASGVTIKELVTASIMNAHVRDQLNALKTPAGGYSVVNEASDYTTNSTSFGDIDSTDMACTFTTGGGDVLIFFTASIIATASLTVSFDVHESVAGTQFFGNDGLVGYATTSTTISIPVAFMARITGLTAASHTFKIQWKVSASTATLYAGAGTSNKDWHPNLFMVEI